MTGKPLRRRTDMRSDSRRIAELSTEERQAAYLFRLSGDVHQACVAFLKSRQLPTGDEASWRGINTRLRDSNATSEATGGKGEPLDPPDGVGPLKTASNTPRRMPLKHGQGTKLF